MNATIELEILMLSGCENGDLLYTRTKEAVGRLPFPTILRVTTIDNLPPDDPRRGFGSPTLIFDGCDLFGLERSSASVPT